MKTQTSVVILTSRGPRHSYFARELAKQFRIAGIEIDDRYHIAGRLWTFLKLNSFNPIRMIGSFLFKRKLRIYEERDQKIENQFFPRSGEEWPEGIPVRKSSDPNGEESIQWVKSLQPDVLVVFGTRMIREPILSLARFGALNLHTGLSPHYRGGQCTFWCLYEGDLEHVGVTVHHLTSRIDGGDIVYTARPEVEPGDTVRSLECKLVRLGTERMIQAVRELAQGKAPRILQREKGKLFLSRMFTLEKRLELERRLEAGWIAKLLRKRSQSEVPA